MIDILLATYNGEKYIDTQITSIINQTYTDWKLLIHDDGSSDTTIEKIKYWCSLDKRINFFDDGVVFHNPSLNFMHLVQFSTAGLICFADQDDFWLEYKLEEMVKAISSRDKQPILVVSSCFLWDTEKKNITPKKIYNQAFNLNQFLFLNGGLQGCAMMFNAQLRELALSQKIDNLYMHDFYFSLLGFTFGEVIYLREELFLYRQHEKNVSVHLKKNIFSYIKQVLKNWDIPVIYATSYYSIDIFYNKFVDKMTDNKKNCFKNYLELKNKNSFYRFWSILCSPFVLGKNGKIKLLIKLLFRPYWKDSYE